MVHYNMYNYHNGDGGGDDGGGGGGIIGNGGGNGGGIIENIDGIDHGWSINDGWVIIDIICSCGCIGIICSCDCAGFICSCGDLTIGGGGIDHANGVGEFIGMDSRFRTIGVLLSMIFLCGFSNCRGFVPD